MLSTGVLEYFWDFGKNRVLINPFKSALIQFTCLEISYNV